MRRLSTAGARLSTGEAPAKAGAAAHRSCFTYGGDVPGSRAATLVGSGRAPEPHTFGKLLILVEVGKDSNSGAGYCHAMKPRTRLVALHPVHGYAIPPPQDVKVSRRNARERNRVQSVNHGFDVLKRHIPTAASVKKMSKVNILSHAVNYIEALTSLLRETPPVPPPPVSSPSSSTSFPPNPEPSPNSFPHQPCYTTGVGGSSYPPPLTPISPNTHPYYQGFRSQQQYESGYDTSPTHGFYSESEHCPPSSSSATGGCPQPASIGTRSHSWTAGDVQARSYPPRHFPPSPAPSDPPSLPPTTHQHPPSTPHQGVDLKREKPEESSGEEDDILDAIAEWQQN